MDVQGARLQETDSTLQGRVELAISEIEDRFMDQKYGIILDYAGRDGKKDIPTPADCRESRPNGMGWWTPIENGAFFNGIYLDGLCNGWKITRRPEYKEQARKISQGLVLLASVGSQPGFIARGVSSDGKSHYVYGSDDQTGPWFYGLWRYVTSGIPDNEEINKLILLMEKTAIALETTDWKLPSDNPSFGFRGEMKEKSVRNSSRLLFIYKALHNLTKNARWQTGYYKLLNEVPKGDSISRIERCAQGIPYQTQNPAKGNKSEYEFWITAVSQASLKALVEMEKDTAVRKRLQQGLRMTGERAALHLGNYKSFDNKHTLQFNANWRTLNNSWKPQRQMASTVTVAREQVKPWSKMSPARLYEDKFVREPLFAAWIVALTGDTELIKKYEPVLKDILLHYDWKKLYMSRFFVAIPLYYEIRSVDNSF